MTPSKARQKDRQAILDILSQSATRLSAQEYIKQIKKNLSIPGRSAKKLLQTLIDEQELSYHYLYGTTYVEQCFLKPVKVTDHFTLLPPGFSQPCSNKHIQIYLHQGISFGSGQHPTTRLCLEGIDYCIFSTPRPNPDHPLLGADIGTGSGVLALAMSLAGIDQCNAWDIDPVSVNEAKKNIALNRLNEKINLFDHYFVETPNTFSIICANLRWPTLKFLKKILYTSLKKDGILILSGVRVWEKELLTDAYTQKGFSLLWQKDEKDWSAFVLIKKKC